MVNDVTIRRSDVSLVSFDSNTDGEIQKTRPAVIISNDFSNLRLNRVQIVPISSRVETLYPVETYVELGGARRKAMADQIATVGKTRILRRLGALDDGDMEAVARVVRLQL